MLVFTNKTSNVCKMSSKDYQKLLKGNITVTYKINNNQTRKSNQFGSKKYKKKLNCSERIDYLARSPAYLTLKNHREIFFHTHRSTYKLSKERDWINQ